MGNRRKPRRPELDLQHDEIHQRVMQLSSVNMTVDEWSDEPPAKYPKDTLAWIMAKLDDPRVNAYHCDACDMVVVTVDKHPGVTPAFVSHGMFGVECDGVATSAWYRVRQEYAVYAAHEWYRPSQDELDNLAGTPGPLGNRPDEREATATREHVAAGGLLLRRIPAGSLTVEEALLRLDTPRTNQLRLEVRGRAAAEAREAGLQQRRTAGIASPALLDAAVGDDAKRHLQAVRDE